MDDPRMEPDIVMASRLRDEAAVLLHNAAQCRDPEECDQLTREALALLDQARAASSRRAEHSAWPGQARSPRLKEGFPTMSRKLVAEFFGTFWLVLGGCGAAVLAAKFPGTGIGFVGVALAFGLTLLTMAYAIGPISGCHINPAVTIGLTVAGRFRAADAPGYIVAQVLGGFVGASILFLIASGAPDFTLAGGFASNGYGAHSPGHYGFWSCALCEIVMTFFFLVVILGATSERAPLGFAPIPIGLVLTLIHLISIPVTNTSVNPARSTAVAIYEGHWALGQLWLFWVAPIIGAVLAGLLHTWLGAEDSHADRDAAVRQDTSTPGEALAPHIARQPR